MSHPSNVSENYFPVTGGLFINDTDGNYMAILNDRSMGGSSLTNGSIELMLNRRMRLHDEKGLTNFIDEKEGDRFGTRGIRVFSELF